jgi:hypothetical protein
MRYTSALALLCVLTFVIVVVVGFTPPRVVFTKGEVERNAAAVVIGYGEDGYPVYSDEVIWEEPRWYQPAYTGLAYDDPYWDDYLYDPWYADDDWYYYGEQTYAYRNPWYVNAFPGFGAMLQRMLPGQHQSTIVVQSPQASQRVYPQPSCWISAEPRTVPYGGHSVLTWSSFNASSAALTGVGSVPVSGSRRVGGIVSPGTYTLLVSGQGGSGSCYAVVTPR